MNPTDATAPLPRLFTRAEHATPLVLVVDDDISVRESLKSLIRSQGWQPALFETARDFLGRPPATAPSCLILDINLPDLSGLDLQRRIAGENASMPIIFVTGYGDVPTSVQAMKAGASEFLTKPFNVGVMIEAMRNALRRSQAALAQDGIQHQLQGRLALLTRRERDVMTLVVTGLMNKQVAGELGISEITVKVHRGRAMKKMHAATFVDLVNMAARLGIRTSPKI